MKTKRRDFLKISGLTAFAGVGASMFSCTQGDEDTESASASLAASEVSWDNVRKAFSLDPALVHMSCLLLASHPRPVQRAIEHYRRQLNQNPVSYLQAQYNELPTAVREAAAAYMEVLPEEIAITDSTTMGTALLMSGLHIRPDQEILSSTSDYPATHRAIGFQKDKLGIGFRTFKQYKDIFNVSADEIVDTLIGEIRPETRLVTGTWVHSSTGLKIPIKRIAQRLAELNNDRSPEDRVLFFVDGVHGFGVEDESVGGLGCDFFSAGTHKWLFGPRGTGLLWGRSDVQQHVSPTIPTFTRNAGWGGKMSPGGFKTFEHVWAMSDAFRLHQQLGRREVQAHIHGLAWQLKEGLAAMGNVVLYTPLSKDLSSGIVCFDVKGMAPVQVVDHLARQGIIASATPYTTSYARLTPGVFNTANEVEAVLSAIGSIA